MQVYILEIKEYWFIHENGDQIERNKRHITVWSDKDDLLAELMKFLKNKRHVLDEDLIFTSNVILSSEGMSNVEKFTKIISLFNRFSKVASELNLKKQYSPSVLRSTWLEISSIESKLRGSAFE